MILAVDAQYGATTATIAGVSFDDWRACEPTNTYVSRAPKAVEYVAGDFYKRELPLILTLLREHSLEPATTIVDGYVYLDDSGRFGLGRHLYDSLDGRVPVVGVAKSAFGNNMLHSEIYRGKSERALYVTCVGVKLEKVKKHIETMHGVGRIPYLLKLADTISRGEHR